jgi:hypothetical protein
VKAIRFQAPQIKLTLLELCNSNSDDAKTKREDESLANSFETFEFLLGLTIWYEILFAVNTVIKKLRSKSTCIGVAMKEMKYIFFEEVKLNQPN